jgi:23S rRNA (guanosine2251-2'-O)-methyltransferase
MAKPGRPGAAKGKKGATKGTGGHGRQALEGRGPTPKAEDRPYHKAFKAKAAAGSKTAGSKAAAKPVRKGEFVAGRSGMGARAISGEVLSGRNSVV